MKVPLFLFLLVLTLDVSALDTLTFENCENLDIGDCNGLRELDLNIAEQKELLTSILESSYSNKHEFIFGWNTNLVFNEIPYTVSPENHKTIRNAWLILSSIMPSVLYSNTLYNNYTGFVQSNYGYELTRPPTYFNGAWSRCTDNPPTSPNEGEAGDCRTEYPQNWDETYIDVYLNNGWIGDTPLTSFNTEDASNHFMSVLNIVNKIQRDHYRWERGSCCRCDYCCWSCGEDDTCCGRSCSRCGCDTYRRNCRFSNMDYGYDSLELSDDKTSFLEQISFSEPSILYDKARSMAYFTINTTNIDHYTLIIDDLELSKQNLEYGYNYSYLPVNILTAQAIDNSELNANVYSSIEESGDSDFISFHLRNKDSYDCMLTIYSYFNAYNVSCNITVLPSTELNITTDKFFYMPNETIRANISINPNFNGNNVNVRYGNYSVNVTEDSSLEFPARININQIKAEYHGDLTQQSASAVKTISVYSGEKPSFYMTIFWLVIAFLVFISVLRMCWIKVFGIKNE